MYMIHDILPLIPLVSIISYQYDVLWEKCVIYIFFFCMKFRSLAWIMMVGSTLALTGCGSSQSSITNNPNIVNTGDIVTVDYTLTWSGGAVFASNMSGVDITAIGTDSLDRNTRSTVTAGDDHTIWGTSIIGASMWDTITRTIDPRTSGEAQYYDKHQVQKVPASAFGTISPTIGDVYDIGGQRAWITTLSGAGDEQIITFDRNPRETRDSYTYDVTITDIINK